MTTFILKTYQSDALKALTLFLRQAETMGLEAAWSHAMQRDGGTPGVPRTAAMNWVRCPSCACAFPRAVARP